MPTFHGVFVNCENVSNYFVAVIKWSHLTMTLKNSIGVAGGSGRDHSQS